MKLLLAFSGTRGDIQPAAVVGAELQRRGHQVTFAAPPNLVSFSAQFGFDVHSFGYDTRAHMNSELVRTRVRSGSPRARLTALRELRDVGWDEMVEQMAGLSLGMDAIVTGFTTEQVAFPFAESGGIPLVALHHAPIRANPLVSPFPGSPLTVPPWINRWSWRVVDAVMWRLTKKRENRVRAALGSPPAGEHLPRRMSRYGVREIQVYDPVFCPELAAQWGDRRPMVGFLGGAPVAGTADGNTDAALQAWISAGPPPIYVGFGSMPVPDPDALVSTIGQVCGGLGERALVSAGWNDFDGAGSDSVRVVGPVDHNKVFPQCRAVVHHGGAGTTSAALRAGKPSLVCWVGSDQPFWGAHLERLGAGASMRLAGLDAPSLDRHLRTVLSPECALRAEELATRLITPESAVGRVADLIESAVTNRSSTNVPGR